MITKPMLASKCKDLSKLDFENNEYWATPKIDGIRALMIDGKLVSRTFKPIRNKYIKTILESVLPDNSDGEIVCPGGFSNTSSGVMRESGQPDFIYYWFDYVDNTLEMPYAARMLDLKSAYNDVIKRVGHDMPCLKTLLPIQIKSEEELMECEQKFIDDGFEGLMLRLADGPYKCGKATEKQQFLLKMKRFEDSEALVEDILEQMKNNNKAEKDAFGRTKRSSCKENLTAANTMGKLVGKDVHTGVEVRIGSGFSASLRKEIWENQSEWIGKVVKYKYQPHGVKDKPRHSVYLGIRDKEDM